MSSVIESIIDSIKGWSPTWSSDVTINTMDIDEMPVKLDEIHCPVRVFSAVDPKHTEEMSFIAIGGPTAKVEWYILDRLYITPTPMEGSLAGNNQRIYQYTASYHDQARQNRSPSTQSHVVSVSVTPPFVRRWPDTETGTPFYVVDCVVHVQEILT